LNNCGEYAARAIERSSVYGLLARVYSREPSKEFLENLRTSDFFKVLIKNKSLKKLTDELAVEYTRLFIGPGGHIYPYESAYCAKKIDIKNFVEFHGLKYNSDFTENSDHISIELEFMKKITDEEVKAWGKKDRRKAVECLKFKKRFIDEHLTKWVSKFSDRVIKEASLSFYREMAKLTKAYILSEAREMKDLVRKGVI